MTPLRPAVLPPDVQRLVQSELRSGERLLWAAQPRPGAYRKQAIGLMIFAVPWTAFAVFWVVSAGWGTGWFGGDRHGGDGPPGLFMLFPLFGLPFVLIGLGMFSAPYWLGRKAARTAYAVTDRRAIVFEGSAVGSGTKVQSFQPERLTLMTRTERADGSGDLVFEEFRERVGTGSRTVRRGFVGIDRVREVEDLIANTLLAGRTRPVG